MLGEKYAQKALNPDSSKERFDLGDQVFQFWGQITPDFPELCVSLSWFAEPPSSSETFNGYSSG
jgi:hypothetical protein